MSLKYKKVYIDTKYRTSDSESTSNFFIELPESMVCPSNTVFYIDDVSIPHSWTTIEPGINSKLYLYLVDDNFVPRRTGSFIIFITDGNYIGSDLAVELQTKLNNALATFEPSTVFQVSYSTKTNTIRIATSEDRIKFYILKPSDLKDKLGGLFTLDYDINKPGDCNEILSNLDGISQEYGKKTHSYLVISICNQLEIYTCIHP